MTPGTVTELRECNFAQPIQGDVMPRRNKRMPIELPEPIAAQVDSAILAGMTCDVSRETRRARGRSEYSRGNTMANRRWGGGSATYRPRAHDLAGAALMAPVTLSTVKTMDDYGTTIPRQHMASVTPEDTILRERARALAEVRVLNEIR